ncbi:ferrochelatase [Enterococcus saccharolyticus]|uniref:Coproporphyrin III ferrochelatase n=1 Tax=Candidatus Enterococcus willemsii TaxID=1857215 RepID=A0ABQ6Z0X5_9ENTE|nr:MULTISPECIES: ferrochelatase [Enterococcus]KAF1304948.1 ferrochelatase [Enterococcus sp. CU12B]MCD5003646.1 ferrochelatase [Enterococcus saccharolyticus]
MQKQAVLLMSYGTPNNTEEIWDYYTHIRHGKEPSKELYEELAGRYEAIGGASPLAQITEAQRLAVEEKLNENSDVEYRVFTGLRHIRPFIEDAVKEIAMQGFKTIHGMVLAPHDSSFIKQYHMRVENEVEAYPEIAYHAHCHFWQQEGFQVFWSNQIQHALDPKKKQKFLFTAHSLPERLLLNGDPYVDEITNAAKAIAQRVKGPLDFGHAWQSAGRTADKWIGPRVEDVTEELLKEGYEEIIYLPFGFVADNLETLYDNDIECKELVEELGGSYRRLDMPNTHPLFIEGLAKEIIHS